MNNTAQKAVRANYNPSLRQEWDDLQNLTNLTSLQSQFWIGQKIHPDKPLFNCVDTFTITGSIKPSHFQAAFQALVDRTDALRTVFEEREGIPQQRLVDKLPYTMEYLDFSQAPAAHASFQAWMQHRSQTFFDFEQRLFDSALAKISENLFIWYLNLHHIIADGWTFYVILQRMEALYRRSLEGRLDEPVPFPSFHDYVDHERAYRLSSQYGADQAYWEKKKAETQPLTFYGRPPVGQPACVRRVDHELGPERTHRLKALARQERFAGKTSNIALFNILAGVLAAYLHRITGNEAISIGTPFSNRPTPVLKETVGLLMQIAPLRITIADGDTYASLIERIQTESAETARHCRYPLINHQNHLYDVIFNFRAVSFTTFQGMPVQENVVHSGVDGYSFSFHVRYPDAESLLLQFDFHPDVFDASQQERAVDHFLHVLDAFLQNPDQPIDRVSLLSTTERRLVLTAWNETRLPFPEDLSIHRLFEEQVERSPDTVAVVFEDKELTYRELNERANQLAHYLRKLGVGPDMIVGICMERSIEMVLGLLAILKAGGAYMPIDPDYPKDRAAFMLEDAAAAVLLSQQRLLERLPQHGVRAIPLDAEWEAIAHESKENPVSGVSTGNLAYVIFTSGSTGTPKGAMNTHRGICNRLLWMQDTYQLTEADRVLQKTPFSFDVSVWEFFWPLLTGACLVVARPGGHQDTAYLVKLIAEQKITTLHFVPSMLQVFLEQEGLEILSCLRRVICSGEALPFELQERFFFCLGTELHNLYGPTEASVDVSFWACKRESNRRLVPIGRPIANTEIYLLDSHLQPIPIGVPGELYIGGDGVARGYLNRPELTAEKFIPNPLSNHPGARLYKTGDLARHLPDGNIEFLGRTDYQVKIRGFRIELGEIEAALGQHPAVRQAVVLAREDVPGEKQLVAYVVAKQKLLSLIPELRSFLTEKLPEHMVPSAFLMLDSLPLTPNGKIDRRALPVPDRARPELAAAFVAPRTPVEEVLAGIWTNVLRVERVGAHDNFLDLGGHSLLAAQVISRMREAFHVDLPLRVLLETPTVAQLAARIEAANEEPPNSTSAPISPLPNENEYPLSFSQQRLWFLSQLEPNSFAYNNTYGFRLTYALNIEALEQTLGEIVRRHEALRTTFSMRNGEPVQVVAEEWSVKLPIMDLTERSDADLTAEVQRFFDNESRRPFNLSSDLMLRATLLRLNDKEHVLFLSVHHIAFDHWSIQVVYRELSLIYNAFSAGRVSPLPEPPIQYKHYAIWQRKLLQDAALENHLAYWKRQLSDSPPVLHLPTDHPRPPVQTCRGARLGLVLPKPLAAALKALSREAGVTLFMTLLAAFKILLHRLSGQDDIVVGSPIAGRDRSETEDLIGLFLNTLVLRTKLSGNPTFRELLTRVRDVALGAYDHRDLPFEKLVEELKPQRDLSHTPLFQVFFNMYNFKEPQLDLDGLSVRHLDLTEPVSMFDLTLYVRERDDATNLSMLYNADLFHPDTASRMFGHFHTLLQGIVANPDQRLSSLSILTDAEKQQQLLVTWNDTEKDYPKNQCIHQVFEAQVERSPDAVAAVFEDRQLSYRELNQRANHLAHYLRKLGVGPEVPVGFCMERSLEMVVGLLGILKAGGAYVPLDPEYPKARLAYMLADAQADFLLTKEPLLEKFPEFKGQTLCVDRDRALFDRKQEENPDTTLEPDNLAYVIYTSGSTGKPKGVLGYHRGVLNYLFYLHETYNLNGADTVLQLPSLSFDASVRDLIGPLTAGARLIIVNDFDAKQPAVLLSKIKEHGVTCLLSVVPTLLNGLLEAGRSGSGFYNSVRLILVSGEALTTSTCEKTKELFPSTLLVNQYGPTECTMTSTYHPVMEAESHNSITPLGRPIPNVRIYVLDNHLNPMPTGIPGEVHIEGVGLARGYMNSPELTAERFIPDPFSMSQGARLYKTGDLARYRNDSNMDFLGRIDHQVKVRGFRIELGEIEAVLTQHPAVQQAVVVAREDVPGDNRLVAYIIPNKDQAPTINDLRNFLKSKLPEYMVPSAFVVLDAFPLTPNRKVDRRALPPPEQSRLEEETPLVAPRTPVEEALVRIWTEVLKLEKVGIHDNFFELGGHSLLATQVISRVREAFQLEVPLRALFENPTVAGLAGQVDQLKVNGNAPNETANVLADIESLSDGEAERLLSQRKFETSR